MGSVGLSVSAGISSLSEPHERQFVEGGREAVDEGSRYPAEVAAADGHCQLFHIRLDIGPSRVR